MNVSSDNACPLFFRYFRVPRFLFIDRRGHRDRRDEKLGEAVELIPSSCSAWSSLLHLCDLCVLCGFFAGSADIIRIPNRVSFG